MRLLVIEDSQRLRENLGIGLRRAGYAVDEAEDGSHGLWLARSHAYDVILLDLMLPVVDGMTVLRQLRAAGQEAHVLILTAKDRLADKVAGFGDGADDYLVKPFAFEELLARVGALARRQHRQRQTVIGVGPLEIDTVARTVAREGRRIELSGREFAVLEYLAARRGQIVSRTDIESHVYDANAELLSKVVDALIYALRKRIDVVGEPSLIRTHRGMGYELVEPP